MSETTDERTAGDRSKSRGGQARKPLGEIMHEERYG